jgi:uncharacterized membrane protein
VTEVAEVAERKKQVPDFDRVRAYFLYFMLYSVIGWCYEVFLEVVVYRWGFTNRGFLFGPYCPVYGFGAVIFILCFSSLKRRGGGRFFRLVKPLIIGAGCMITATAIELAVSYMLELLTGSWPWQTYADYTYNFQARIALSPSIRFGLGGLLFLYVLQPCFEKAVSKLDLRSFNICFRALAAIILIDCACTFLPI